MGLTDRLRGALEESVRPPVGKWVDALSDVELEELRVLLPAPRPFSLVVHDRLLLLQERGRRRYELGLPGWSVGDCVGRLTWLYPGCGCVIDLCDSGEVFEPGTDVQSALRRRVHPFVPRPARVVPVAVVEERVDPVPVRDRRPVPVRRQERAFRPKPSAESVDRALAGVGIFVGRVER